MQVLIQDFQLELGFDRELRARFNVAPTQDILTVRQSEGGRELVPMRWGLVPSWSKEFGKGPLLINARSETIATKPSFRSAYKSRRCLIPADGYYEWKQEGKGKQPYLFEMSSHNVFAFAGLWERWQTIESCTIITTEANELAAQFHDRMPAILSPNDYGAWLDPATKDVGRLLTSYPATEVTATAINPIVNNARNETPERVEPV